jgi:hypothetical protein
LVGGDSGGQGGCCEFDPTSVCEFDPTTITTTTTSSSRTIDTTRVFPLPHNRTPTIHIMPKISHTPGSRPRHWSSGIPPARPKVGAGPRPPPAAPPRASAPASPSRLFVRGGCGGLRWRDGQMDERDRHRAIRPAIHQSRLPPPPSNSIQHINQTQPTNRSINGGDRTDRQNKHTDRQAKQTDRQTDRGEKGGRHPRAPRTNQRTNQIID